MDDKVKYIFKSLEGKVRLGEKLDVAIAEMKRFMTDPESHKAIDEAASEYRKLVNRIERLGKPKSLHQRGRAAWYAGPQPDHLYWPALKRYFREKKKPLSEETVELIDAASTKIVSLLDFPGGAAFSTKGLVVGYVQSGKTVNFTSVISKAADVGFRVFIVLSGMTDSLRKQTQERLQDELIARSPKHWMEWTTRDRDFVESTVNINALLDTRDKCQIAVVKKNASRLRRMLGVLNRADQRLLRETPVMVIDDECDQASVGIKDKQMAINDVVRKILEALPRVAYVGYTATPYANVLIDPSFADDLYPRDFIVSLERPDAYFGAERLFGRDALDADDVPAHEEGLDMIRIVPDDEVQFLRPASQSVKDSFQFEVAPSLRDALFYYILATAAREFRGQTEEHSCMLVHTSVNSVVHQGATGPIRDLLDEVTRLVRVQDAAQLQELAELWQEEQLRLDPALVGQTAVSFADLQPHLLPTLQRIETKVENCVSDDRIDFREPGRRYIVIGGNVLARGLTVEGLVASFFLRTSSQYDSLMQMGRWFGYRPGYEDLPRVWMTGEMSDYFRDMATVEAEIRRDIDIYESENVTPLEFAVRIRKHPVLAITAKNKMLASVERQMSFGGRHIQTRKFRHTAPAWISENWNAGAALLRSAEKDGRQPRAIGDQHVLYEDVSFTHVIQFLKRYNIHEAHEDMKSTRIVEYITTQNNRDGGVLGRWNIGIIGKTGESSKSESELGPLGKVRLVSRSRLKDTMADGSADIKALMSKKDLAIDLDAPPPGDADWDDLKEARDTKFSQTRPLLLLYPIDKDSPPLRSDVRAPLGAVQDVLGLGLVFPEPRVDTPVLYVSARIDATNFENAEYPAEEDQE